MSRQAEVKTRISVTLGHICNSSTHKDLDTNAQESSIRFKQFINSPTNLVSRTDKVTLGDTET